MFLILEVKKKNSARDLNKWRKPWPKNDCSGLQAWCSFKWRDTRSNWSACKILAYHTNQNGLIAFYLWQGVVSFLGFRSWFFSGLFPHNTTTMSSSCEIKLPVGGNETQNITKVSNPYCCRIAIHVGFDRTKFALQLNVFTCWELLPAESWMPCENRKPVAYFQNCKCSCSEPGTGGKFLCCPLKIRCVLCFNVGICCSDLRRVRSCGYCPDIYKSSWQLGSGLADKIQVR